MLGTCTVAAPPKLPAHLLALGAERIVQKRPAALPPGQRAAARPPQADGEMHGALRQRRRAGSQEEEQRGRAGAGARPTAGWTARCRKRGVISQWINLLTGRQEATAVVAARAWAGSAAKQAAGSLSKRGMLRHADEQAAGTLHIACIRMCMYAAAQ